MTDRGGRDQVRSGVAALFRGADGEIRRIGAFESFEVPLPCSTSTARPLPSPHFFPGGADRVWLPPAFAAEIPQRGEQHLWILRIHRQRGAAGRKVRALEHQRKALPIGSFEDGVLVGDKHGLRERVSPIVIDVVCGVGSGDAFGAAFCHGLLEGWSWATCAAVVPNPSTS